MIVYYTISYMIPHTISYTVYDIRHRMYFSSCLKGCKSAGSCLWNLVLLCACVSRFRQFFSKLTSLTCDSDCDVQHRPPAIPRPTMWICARTVLCTDHLSDPMPAHSSKICLWRGPCWPQPPRISGGTCGHCTCNTPSSSPLGSNEKLSCCQCTKIGTVRLADRPRGGLHSWLVRRQCLWTATTALF
jgi:hypothetical protein